MSKPAYPTQTQKKKQHTGTVHSAAPRANEKKKNGVVGNGGVTTGGHDGKNVGIGKITLVEKRGNATWSELDGESTNEA